MACPRIFPPPEKVELKARWTSHSSARGEAWPSLTACSLATFHHLLVTFHCFLTTFHHLLVNLQEPVEFVQVMLDERDKYERIVVNAFGDDKIFRNALNQVSQHARGRIVFFVHTADAGRDEWQFELCRVPLMFSQNEVQGVKLVVVHSIAQI